MSSKNNNLLVLAGGSGSRLWPLSRNKRPKQFLDLLNNDMTMLQSTISRVSEIEFSKIIIVCNEEHKFFAQQQIEEINIEADIITEPVGKNTAPAIALAAFHLNDKDNLLVLPADHHIEHNTELLNSINLGFELVEDKKIVTMGIKPVSPNTGYGYIKKGTPIKGGYNIVSFIEKPDLKKAEHFLESQDYFWNSGMFLLNTKIYLDELKRNNQELYDCCKASYKNASKDGCFTTIHENDFSPCPPDSIDYAVMEKTSKSVVVPLNAGWSDVGTWKSLHEVLKNENNNFLKGDVKIIDSNNCFIDSEFQLVTALGLDNIGIIATKDSILVHDLKESQAVKKIIDKLKSENRSELNLHREVHRPWGKYDSIDNGTGFQVKRLTVWPGEKLSVQMHYHRSEHWVVVSGTAKVHYGEDSKILQVNESTYHDKEVVHALENIGEIPCILIEVQIGNYLGEDDIVRYEDIYGRS